MDSPITDSIITQIAIMSKKPFNIKLDRLIVTTPAEASKVTTPVVILSKVLPSDKSMMA